MLSLFLSEDHSSEPYEHTLCLLSYQIHANRVGCKLSSSQVHKARIHARYCCHTTTMLLALPLVFKTSSSSQNAGMSS